MLYEVITAFLLMKSIGIGGYKTIFAVSIMPIILALIMFTFVKEKKEHNETKKREKFWVNAKKLDKNLKLYLIVAFLFTLGNSSNAFVITSYSIHYTKLYDGKPEFSCSHLRLNSFFLNSPPNSEHI